MAKGTIRKALCPICVAGKHVIHTMLFCNLDHMSLSSSRSSSAIPMLIYWPLNIQKAAIAAAATPIQSLPFVSNSSSACLCCLFSVLFLQYQKINSLLCLIAHALNVINAVLRSLAPPSYLCHLELVGNMRG